MIFDFCDIEEDKVGLINPIILAYIGDAVYECYVRVYIAGKGATKTGLLHRESIKYVSAKAQAKVLDEIYDALSDDERNIVRRGRNANANTIPKNTTLAVYKKATAFEALIGYLFLSKKNDRMEEIIRSTFSGEETYFEKSY